MNKLLSISLGVCLLASGFANSSIPTLVTDAGLHLQMVKQAEKKQYCFFTPPEGWIPNTSKKSEAVQIEFYTKGEKELAPSINLATENVKISAKEYLQAVRSLHKANKDAEWRDLGKIETLAGDAFLTEIDIASPHGQVRQLQVILVKDSKAYIITACALKEEFAKFYKDFQKSFKSFVITKDVISYLKDSKKRESLLKLKHSLQNFVIQNSQEKTAKDIVESENFKNIYWKPFQDFVISECPEMGAYWQIVVLKDAQEDLL